MSWRNPRFCYMHAARAVGASAITSKNAFHSDYPKDFLIDDRAGSLCKFAGSASDHSIIVDLGASPVSVERVYVPVGHNYSGTQIGMEQDTDIAFPSPTGILYWKNTTAAAVDHAMDVNSSERYVRFVWNGTGTWETPELILTQTKATSRGPEPGWEDYYRHNTLDFDKESGVIASLSLGADRRYFALSYRDVKLAADLTIFSDLVSTCGTSKPFLFDPPFTTESAVWVKLVEDSRQLQDPAMPAATNSTQRQIRLSMLEHIA